MKKTKRFGLLFIAAVLPMSGVAAPALASKVQVTVPGTTMPWNYSNKLNHTRDFGTDDGTAPVVVTLAALGASAGQKLSIKYVSGTICPGGDFPCVDARGFSGYVTDHNTGSSGNYFPSFYVAKEPTYLEEMIAVFTDSNGKIIGRPFAVPDHGGKTIPANATQIQLGANDDVFSDNSGSWLINVSVK